MCSKGTSLQMILKKTCYCHTFYEKNPVKIICLEKFQLQLYGFVIIIYNYFTGKLREFYFTKGSQDQFCLQNIQSTARDVFYTTLVLGTLGKVKFVISRKRKLYTILSSFKMKKCEFFPENFAERVVILHNSPKGR